MRYLLTAALLAIPAHALAEDGGRVEQPRIEAKATPVIGGSAAPAGKWPDTAALLWGGSQACTGTLIAPTVVLTAGHCIDAGGSLDVPDSVQLGGGSLSRPSAGDIISVQKGILYPDSWNTVDVSVLVLAQPSTVAPRPIATGWARFDITNGAAVQFVGYGTVDRNGSQGTDALMEAPSTITDFNCSVKAGCNEGARPDGELGAGGMGIDTCPGDSGGPMYLMTDYGNFLAGVTSRGYNDNQFACSEGGIYGRPDKVVDWIETQTGVKVSRGPAPEAPAIMMTRGTAAETMIVHNDPKAKEHIYAIATPPGNGNRAAVREDGLVRVCAAKDIVGDDAVVVSVTDKADATRTLSVRIPITIQDGEPDDDCDPEEFGGGGCCDTRRSASGSIPLALFVALVLRRRRRAR